MFLDSKEAIKDSLSHVKNFKANIKRLPLVKDGKKNWASIRKITAMDLKSSKAFKLMNNEETHSLPWQLETKTKNQVCMSYLFYMNWTPRKPNTLKEVLLYKGIVVDVL